jgi:hypothetical protein
MHRRLLERRSILYKYLDKLLYYIEVEVGLNRWNKYLASFIRFLMGI